MHTLIDCSHSGGSIHGRPVVECLTARECLWQVVLVVMRKSDVVSTKWGHGDNFKGMPVVSWVCQGDSSGDKELGVAVRPVVECLTCEGMPVVSWVGGNREVRCCFNETGPQ